MAVDEANGGQTIPSLNQSSASVESTPRPTPRKLPKFPVDLHMPMTVYWPWDDDKIIVRFAIPFLASLAVYVGSPNVE